MERKNPLIPLLILIGILVILLVISIVGWTRARNELVNVKNGDGQLVELKDSLTVCDDVSTLEKQVACVERLSDLSKLLSDYEEKIKGLQAKVQ